MPTQSHTQAVLNHYQQALTFSPHPAKIQERIAGRPWMLWDIPQKALESAWSNRSRW